MINWFPGHMSQSIKKLNEYLNLVDIVIELRDSRAPISTENHLFSKLNKNKKHIIILTKKDLSDPIKTNKYKNEIIAMSDAKIFSLNLKKDSLGEVKNLIKYLSIKSKNNTSTMIKKIMIIGIPNCGKSTFINRILDKKVSYVANKPGVTRKISWYKSKEFYLMDTPGILWGKIESPIFAKNLCLIGSISEKVYDKENICSYLLNFLNNNYPEILKNQIKTKDKINFNNLEFYELLDLINYKFGFKSVNRYYDLSSKILNEFQKGKLGRVTLDII